MQEHSMHTLERIFVASALVVPLAAALQFQTTGSRVAIAPVSVDDQPGFTAPFVPPPPLGNATRFVAPTGSNSNPGTQSLPWREIAYAASHMHAGDIVDIADGMYASPITIGIQGTAAQPVIFRAVGIAAIVSGAGTNSVDRDALFVTFASHVIVHGLKIQNAFRAGVRVDQSDHVTIQACACTNNGRWGIFTDFSDDLALLGNECSGSVLEHGIYHSNSGDRALIRGNWCHDNWSSGIQINADPSQGGDGICSECVVERNLLQRNGLGTGLGGGGAAINLASVRNCTIRNNVLVANRASGIVLWDDGQGTQWGSKNNFVLHNTVLMNANEGRFAILFSNGSTGNHIEDNVLVGGARGAITFTNDSLPGLVSDFNVLYSLSNWSLVVEDVTGQTYTFAAWQAQGHDLHSLHQNPNFTNAPSGDWSLAPGSPGRDTGVDAGVASDYQGSPRPRGAGFDMGAYER
jgi:parallel beta-helix repeat protein